MIPMLQPLMERLVFATSADMVLSFVGCVCIAGEPGTMVFHRYSPEELEEEVAIVSREVCPPDKFHARFS